MVADGFDDIFTFFCIEDHQDHARERRLGFADDDLLVPLFFEPEKGETIPGEQLPIGADAARRHLVGCIFGLVRREDVGKKREGDNDPNEEEFFEEQENHADEEGDRKNGRIKFARAFFIGACRSYPFEQDFLDFDIGGYGACFCLVNCRFGIDHSLIVAD